MLITTIVIDKSQKFRRKKMYLKIICSQDKAININIKQIVKGMEELCIQCRIFMIGLENVEKLLIILTNELVGIY